MKEYFINDLTLYEDITDFFLVKDIAYRTGSNQKQYLDLLLADASGEIKAKKWDISDEEARSLSDIRIGDIIKIKAAVTEWNGVLQFKVQRIRRAGPQDTFDRVDYYKAAPEDPQSMYDFIYAAAEAIEDEDLRKLSLRIMTDDKEKLLYYPAASRNHHAEFAGLLWHMKRMLMLGVRACEVYTQLNRDLIVTGVIIHDIEKLREMNSDQNGMVSEYTFEGKMLGHLVQGVVAIDKLAEELGIGKEKSIMLEHMILSHHYEPEYGSPKRPLFPEAEMLHYLDIIDTRLFDMDDALLGVTPGGFSEWVKTLENRRIYKREW